MINAVRTRIRDKIGNEKISPSEESSSAPKWKRIGGELTGVQMMNPRKLSQRV